MLAIDVEQFLPHGPPFILPQGVLKHDAHQVQAFRDIAADDYFLQGHFPHQPIFPGVMIIEALAQTAGLLLSLHYHCPHALLARVDKARFKWPVLPSVRLLLHVRLLRHRVDVFQFQAEAQVEDRQAASAVMTLMKQEPA